VKKVVDYTMSVCPICKKILPAKIYFKSGKTFIEKECSEHGKIIALHSWDSEELYKMFSYIYKENKKLECLSPLNCEACGRHLKRLKESIGCYITGKCNLNCPFCYEGDRNYIDEFNIEDFKKLIKNFPYIKTIALVGGEVTIKKDLFRIINFLRKKGFNIEIDTNGIRTANESFVKTLKENNVSVSISFDLNPKTYNRIRKKDLTNYVLKSIKNFNKYRVNFGILATITKENLMEIGSAIKFATKSNASFLRLSPVFYFKTSKRKVWERFSDIKLSDIIKVFCKEMKVKNEDIMQQSEFRYMAEKIRDYVSSGDYRTHLCHIIFWFKRKNEKLVKYNSCLEFKLLFGILKVISKKPFLIFLRKFKLLNSFIEKMSKKYSFYDKRMFKIYFINIPNPYNIDLRYLQSCNAFIVVKKKHINAPVPFCYFFNISPFS
jgi:uncharacterized radical SAM superfamily Fe-S cluster-containing enzyme